MKFENFKKRNNEQFDYIIIFNFDCSYIKTKSGEYNETWNSDNDLNLCKEIEENLKFKSEGDWKRFGNKFMFSDLSDTFRIRLEYDEKIKKVQKAI